MSRRKTQQKTIPQKLAAKPTNRNFKLKKKKKPNTVDSENFLAHLMEQTEHANSTKTMHSQINKASQKFHARNVVFVGDRGMIKSPQQKELSEADFDFITALTKKQIEN